MRRRMISGCCALLIGAVVSGCASSAPGDITAAAARVLVPEVQHVREVAATHNYSELRAAVAELKSLVQQQLQAGNLSTSRATAIEDAADVLLQDARPKAKPTPSPTTTSPSPSPTSESPTPPPAPTTLPPTVPPTETASPLLSTSASAAPAAAGRAG